MLKHYLNIDSFLQKFRFSIIFFLCVIYTEGNAQSLQRQCVASAGNCTTINGTSVQQTIGQSYNTTSSYGSNVRYNPGFLQPIFSVETIKSSISAKVFPNPASKQITIESNSVLENVIVRIVDMSGQILLNEKINEFKNYIVDCAAWANGIYLITLSDSKNDLYSSKLIISK